MMDAVKSEKGQRKEFLGDLMNHHKNVKELTARESIDTNNQIQDGYRPST